MEEASSQSITQGSQWPTMRRSSRWHQYMPWAHSVRPFISTCDNSNKPRKEKTASAKGLPRSRYHSAMSSCPSCATSYLTTNTVLTLITHHNTSLMRIESCHYSGHRWSPASKQWQRRTLPRCPATTSENSIRLRAPINNRRKSPSKVTKRSPRKG